LCTGGGFAIGARVSLLSQHSPDSPEREMSASACTRFIPGYLRIYHVPI